MRPVLLALSMLVASTGPVRAQVIEIADDGSAQVLGGGTLSPDPAVRLARARSGQFDIEESFSRAARDHRLDLGLLRAVAWQESRGNNAAVSRKGALGIMQLMPATAAALGVDPRDPEANIKGGAAYLARQLATFGSVPLALAAYNAGPGAVLRYGGIPPYSETRGYVATIMRRWTGSPVALPVSTTGRPLLTTASEPTTMWRARALPFLLIEVPSE